MAVPKRRHSKSRVRNKRNSHYKRGVIQVQKTKDGKGVKRPHFDEKKEI